MKFSISLKYVILGTLFILIIGGLGGIILERVIFPYLSTLPLLKNVKFLTPAVSHVITKREEIRIYEGINQTEIISRVKGSLATVYLYSGEFGSAKYHLIDSVSGALVTNDGIIIIPNLNLRSDYQATVLLPDQAVQKAKILGTDNLTGLTFLKITGTDLPVIKQALSRGLAPGEKLLAIKSTEMLLAPSVKQVILSTRSVASPSLLQTYDFGELNSSVVTDSSLDSTYLGAIVVNRDGFLVGFVTMGGKGVRILRSEDLKLALNNFLEDQKLSWPDLKISYQILGQEQAKLLGLSEKYGILIKSSANSLLQPNDFVFAIDDKPIQLDEGFQEILLGKKIGDKVRLRLMRSAKELEIELTL